MALPGSVQALIDRQGATAGREWLIATLESLVSLGCEPFVPPAQDLRYINVKPPVGVRPSRLCSIQVRTASVEFQADTFPLALSLGLDRFRHVPKGDKAAITPRSAADLKQIDALAAAELQRRRGDVA